LAFWGDVVGRRGELRVGGGFRVQGSHLDNIADGDGGAGWGTCVIPELDHSLVGESVESWWGMHPNASRSIDYLSEVFI
jgi:hypothetical protein